MASVGQDVFAAQVTNKFGLVLTDESVRSIASELGWQDDWLMTNRRRGKAPPPPKSGDLAHMFKASSSVVSDGASSVPLGATPPPMMTVVRFGIHSCLNRFVGSINQQKDLTILFIHYFCFIVSERQYQLKISNGGFWSSCQN